MGHSASDWPTAVDGPGRGVGRVRCSDTGQCAIGPGLRRYALDTRSEQALGTPRRLNRSAETNGRVDLPEEPARDRREPPRVAEAGLRRHRGPGVKREREGDPRVAVVGVVLDEDLSL